MNAFEFFNAHFGRHLVPQTNRPHADAWTALKSTYPVTTKEGKLSKSRLSSGWAIIRPGETLLQLALRADGLTQSPLTRFEAFAAELDGWDGRPRLFLTFDKAPLPIAHLFLTVDLRAVRICGVSGVETFDATRPPPPDAGTAQVNIEKHRKRHAARP